MTFSGHHLRLLYTVILAIAQGVHFFIQTFRSSHSSFIIPAGINLFINLFKVHNRNTRTKCEICSKLTIRTPERRLLYPSGVFIVNSEHISHLALVLLLLTLSR